MSTEPEPQESSARANKPRADAARFGEVEHRRRHWHYHASPGTQLAQYLEPGFWAAQSRRMQPLDRIEVTEELGAWTATLAVCSVGPDGVDLALVSFAELGGITSGTRTRRADPFRIKFGGAFRGWAIYRNEELVFEGLASEAAAEHWLEDHIRTSKGGHAA